VRTGFFSETGMDDRVGDLVQNDLPHITIVAHREKP
jgi:hypothetical protein